MMHNKPKLFLCGLARNCATSLLSNIPSILSLRQNWDLSGVILENESTDETPKILQALEKLCPSIQIHNPKLEEGLTRYERMAYLRNEALIIAEAEQVDWICVADLDLFQFVGLDSYFPEKEAEAIMGLMPKSYVPWHPGEAIKYMDRDWVYYDLLAVEFKDGTRPHWIGDMQYPDTKDEFKKADKSSVSGAMPCNSAFGGMAFYKANKIRGKRYTGTDCEHIAFNKSIGGIYITDKVLGIYAPSN
jgi:hypothetical protein